MPTQRWIPAAWLGLCLLMFDAAAAVRPGFDVEQWNTERGLPPNSLPQNSVIAMAQTREGYLWLGTLNGLARFDGRHFTVFDESNTPQLGGGAIVFLFADQHSGLWVGTETTGAVLVKNGVVTPLQIGGSGRAARLVSAGEQTNGVVWLCMANGELCRYRAGNVDVWSRPEFNNSRGLIIEKSGWLVVATDNELFTFDPAGVVPGKNLPEGQRFAVRGRVDYLLASRSGGFWLLANGQVRKFRLNHSELQPERDFGRYPWTGAPVLSACEDREGNLVVGTLDHGLTWFDTDGRAETLTTSSEVLRDNNTVLSLHADREGSLWVGTDGGGLQRIRRQVFEVQPQSRGKTIQSVCSDGAGGVWFAIDRKPLQHWRDGQLREFGVDKGLTSLSARTVFVDRSQGVWAGTEQGLFQLETNFFRPAPKWEAASGAITALHQDRRGTLWAGTRNGLFGWDGTNWSSPKGLGADEVRALADDAQGNLWIGTAGAGLKWMHDSTVTGFHKADGLPSDYVSALLADADGILWIGTSGSGLARFDGHLWTHYSTSDGLAGNSIRYLIEDNDGNLWLGSNAGLMRVAKAEFNAFARGKISSVSCRSYGSSEGMPTRECSPGGQPTACHTTDGALWFATIKGLASVHPARLSRNTNPPPVMIEAVLVDDVLQNTNRLRLNWPEQVVIPAGRERLEIRYTSLNLLAPERARFKSQLQREGFEKRLIDVADTRVASFPNLPAGNYRFHLVACNEDDVWNETAAGLDVIVVPPFWRTWWFLTICAVTLLGAIVGTVHLISTQKLQRQLALLRQQEALEKERARIARDLHDQLGANLTQVSLLGEMAEADKNLPREVEAHARQISATARDTALALDEIVWAANPANDTLEGLVTYTCKYAQEYLAVAGLSYRLEAPEKLPSVSIPPDVRHNVFLAFKESVNNVVKHAHATAVRVRVRLETNRMILEIEDNGCGVADADKAKGRNGLRNMSQRMEDVRGEFSLGPGASGGTLIRLTSPLGKPAP